jgi:hypothetical protein
MHKGARAHEIHCRAMFCCAGVCAMTGAVAAVVNKEAASL